MIVGTVSENLEAVVDLQVAGPAQGLRTIQAVVDSGFNGFLTLPRKVIDDLELEFADYSDGRLADVSIVHLRTYGVVVIWHGAARTVIAAETEGTALAGMELLRGNRLTVDVVEGGSIEISPL